MNDELMHRLVAALERIDAHLEVLVRRGEPGPADHRGPDSWADDRGPRHEHRGPDRWGGDHGPRHDHRGPPRDQDPWQARRHGAHDGPDGPPGVSDADRGRPGPDGWNDRR